MIAENKIRQLEEEKRMLAAKALAEGQENERKRVAKELHDGLGVLLSTAKIQVSSVKDENEENKELLEKATQLIEQATGDVRRISHNMMPGLLTRFGLFEAVEELFDKINSSKKPAAELQVEGEKIRMAENTEIMLYRVIQELVNNTMKHAEASKITLKIVNRDDVIGFNYQDDGKGFNLTEKLDAGARSIGLQSIQSRINFVNGKLFINSEPGKGAEFEFEVPVNE